MSGSAQVPAPPAGSEPVSPVSGSAHVPAPHGSKPAGPARRGRGPWVAGLAVALLVAGVVSWYASASPDGLEWAAEQAGFLDTAEDSAVAASPLADYGVSGVGSERLSGGLAGVVGVLVTLLLAGGLALLLRRRGRDAAPAED
ncbi:PDGLE domain-containing protein [Geodermatophilus poikilotrophus]|uniref:Cobalt/nickel transport protein n=1 Tax=Geodermatophilus poikilotrophus TaxID=1333667 RepID=A0A1I0G362_9ACTN|nr:PDGLE domain-containing protein [Geodermatophilus poikilotrophus]SET65029.1 cobalt/nickel transport protein [Geodermatophilus poikilotrophus]